MSFHYFAVFLIDNEFSHHLLDLSISNRSNISLLSYLSSLFVNKFNRLSNGENLTDVAHHIKNIILSEDLIINPNPYQQRLDIDDTFYYQIDVVYYGNILEEINFASTPLKHISIYNNVSNVSKPDETTENQENNEENNDNCEFSLQNTDENNENENNEENILNIQTRLYQYVSIFCFFRQIVTPFLL